MGATNSQLMRTVLNKNMLFWCALAAPAAVLLGRYGQGQLDSMEMLHPTGEWSARLMIAAMLLTPLGVTLGRRSWLIWLTARRRWIGVAAFGYAALHLIFYLIDMGNFQDILAEWRAPGIWTGWAAILLMLPLALTSNNIAMSWLKAGWKRLQRLVYPAAILVLLHWIWVHNSTMTAFLHFLPLAMLTLVRLASSFRPSHKDQGV